ncbi:MAG: ABC transporter ATP-binding protein [Chloroflexota bacterium]
MQATENIICTNHLEKRFNGTFAVQGLNLSVPAGVIFGFIGPSGSGKTTTIRLLTGYYQPTAGEVKVFGKPPNRFTRSDREKLGYLPQLFSLYPHLTVWENINFAASIYGLSFGRKKKLVDILAFVELDKDHHKLARNLSGGMQRRLSLATTLVHEPRLIFLDEPTAGVDPVLRQKFWDYFRSLREEGRTLFITTQYVGEAAYCDQVGVIDRGKLLTVDTPDRLRYRAFGGDLVDLHTAAPLDYSTLDAISNLPFVLAYPQRHDDYRARILVKEANTDVAALLDWARGRHLEIKGIEAYSPPFEDVFVELVKGENVDA